MNDEACPAKRAALRGAVEGYDLLPPLLEWLFNSPLYFQNRLRHRDYLKIFTEEGLDLVEDDHGQVTADDLSARERVPLHSKFHGYSVFELPIPSAHILLRKSPLSRHQPSPPS